MHLSSVWTLDRPRPPRAQGRARPADYGPRSTGQEGFERALDEQPDLILLDQQLPDMAGSELLGRLRREPRTRNRTVVFLTATSSGAALAALRRLGAADVIRKPFNPEALGDRVTRIMRSQGDPDGPPAVERPHETPAATNDLLQNMLSMSRVELGQLYSMLEDLESFNPAAAGQITHRWIGRGGTYGTPEITELGQRVEMLVAAFPSRRDELMATLASLERLFAS